MIGLLIKQPATILGGELRVQVKIKTKSLGSDTTETAGKVVA